MCVRTSYEPKCKMDYERSSGLAGLDFPRDLIRWE